MRSPLALPRNQDPWDRAFPPHPGQEGEGSLRKGWQEGTRGTHWSPRKSYPRGPREARRSRLSCQPLRPNKTGVSLVQTQGRCENATTSAYYPPFTPRTPTTHLLPFGPHDTDLSRPALWAGGGCENERSDTSLGREPPWGRGNSQPPALSAPSQSQTLPSAPRSSDVNPRA